MSSLYDRVAAKPGGLAALATARLREEMLVALHRAFDASGLRTQAELARRLNVRKSAVSQVFRGDGNVRVNTLAEYLFAMGFELEVNLVVAGEPRRAELEGRTAVRADVVWNSITVIVGQAKQPLPLTSAATQPWFQQALVYNQFAQSSAVPNFIVGELVGAKTDAP